MVMKKMFFISVSFFFFMSTVAYAATMTVVGGELQGAQDVMVNGIAYDVSFEEGTYGKCEYLYSGCNRSSVRYGTFLFGTSELARLASEALIAQVYVDSAADPKFIRGMGTTSDWGMAWTPYSLMSFGSKVAIWGARVFSPTYVAPNPIFGTPPSPTLNWEINIGRGTKTGEWETWAVWEVAASAPAPVPEPSTILLLVGGLVGLAIARRKRVSFDHKL